MPPKSQRSTNRFLLGAEIKVCPPQQYKVVFLKAHHCVLPHSLFSWHNNNPNLCIIFNWEKFMAAIIKRLRHIIWVNFFLNFVLQESIQLSQAFGGMHLVSAHEIMKQEELNQSQSPGVHNSFQVSLHCRVRPFQWVELGTYDEEFYQLKQKFYLEVQYIY